MSDMQNHKNSFKYNKKITKKLRKCTFEHFMWLQPSFFCIGDLQFGHGLELVTSHRQFAEFSVSSSVPCTEHHK